MWVILILLEVGLLLKHMIFCRIRLFLTCCWHLGRTLCHRLIFSVLLIFFRCEIGFLFYSYLVNSAEKNLFILHIFPSILYFYHWHENLHQICRKWRRHWDHYQNQISFLDWIYFCISVRIASVSFQRFFGDEQISYLFSWGFQRCCFRTGSFL